MPCEMLGTSGKMGLQRGDINCLSANSICEAREKKRKNAAL